MAGGFTTPELVAAVSNAGGLGSLGGAYLSPSQLAEAIEAVRRLTDRPFNVNLFAGGYAQESTVDPQPMLALMSEIHVELGLEPPVLPPLQKSPFAEQLEVVLTAKPTVFSFTFGVPGAEDICRLKAAGILIVGTATTAAEALYLAKAGVDAIASQGSEAGGHRGTFLGSFEAALVPSLDLVREIRSKVPLPVIASGGLMDGADIHAALNAGAVAVQLGTAFMTCPEAGTPAVHKEAMLAARTDNTILTRAFSGRMARGMVNDFAVRLKEQESSILPFPLQNSLTRPMRTQAAKKNDARFLSLWAGTGVTRSRELSAAELVRQLVREIEQKKCEAVVAL